MYFTAPWTAESKISTKRQNITQQGSPKEYRCNYNYYTFSLIYFTLPNQHEHFITLTQATSITHLTCTLMLKNKKVTTHVNPKITAWSNGLMSTSVSLMCCWIFSSLNFTFAKRVSSFRATSYETKNRSTQSVTSLCKIKSFYYKRELCSSWRKIKVLWLFMCRVLWIFTMKFYEKKKKAKRGLNKH